MSHSVDPAVVLERDLREHGSRRGDLGAVMHVYGDQAIEVEFVRLSGQTQALVQVGVKDVRSVRDADLPVVRTVEVRRGAA
ncbi:MAG: DUF4926 domain-containing protein [Gemmatimonadaceae bacterium]